MEVPQPPQVGAYTKTDLPRIKKAAQTLSSRVLQYLEVPIGPESKSGCHGSAQLDELFK